MTIMKRKRELTDLDETILPKREKIDRFEIDNVVFCLKHKVPSTRQDKILCKTLIHSFSAFVTALRYVVNDTTTIRQCGRANPLFHDRMIPIHVFTIHEMDVLREICDRLNKHPWKDDIYDRWDICYEPWLPEYGCVLQRTMINAASIQLDVIFLDGWTRTLHFLPTGKCIHSAMSMTNKHQTICCGYLDTAFEKEFDAAFLKKLHAAQVNKGSKRNAGFNTLGHQKTPQFIVAVVRRAIAAASKTRSKGEEEDSYIDERFFPQGGTTDVGQHTGGNPRGTCWPIVQAVIAENLCCGQGFFQKIMVMFQLSLLQAAMLETQSAFRRGIDLKDGCDAVDDLLSMLQVVIKATVDLLEGGYNISEVHDQCKYLRSSIDGLVDCLNDKTAMCYCLPDPAKMQQLHTLNGGIKVESPRREQVVSPEASDEKRHLRVLTNLAGCWYLDGVTCSLKALLSWEKSSGASKSYKCILVLRTFESFMFARSAGLSGEDVYKKSCDDDENFIENIKMFSTLYKENVCAWRQIPQLTSILDAEQRSREMLVMWIAYCFVHQKCVDQVRFCAEYNIALNWQDLKVAVLSDRVAITALRSVSKYIRGWNEKTRGPQLFHLTNQDPTFSFGQRFALNNSIMMDIYNRDVAAWEQHVQRKWKEIERKKSIVAEIRAHLDCLTEKLQSKQRELADENDRMTDGYTAHYNSKVKTKLTADIVFIESQIKQSKKSLKKKLIPPPPLVRPLPPQKDHAIQIIFMLTMPRSFELLGSLCLIAQRALAPTKPTAEMEAFTS